ncbi:MucR family transcriptional regulator [Devosia sp.]|uniref:MucR family transcriptional regulator n=1 Tax=Devosia sp. TaxID=1871048 RepID=UPI002EF21167
MTNVTAETADGHPQAVEHTTAIVAAYVSKNPVAADHLPRLIGEVHSAIRALHTPQAMTAAPPAEERTPAVPIRKSVTPEAIICLEDGKRFASLKRHLRTRYKLTPEQYREKWGLPAEYPMVAPNYSARRSQLAKASGLGRRGAFAN